MTKFVKVSNEWTDEKMDELVETMEQNGLEAVIVRDREMEVYDGDLEEIDIESGEEILEEERFSGNTLYEVK